MSTLYDIINILPVSLISVILFSGYAGMPEGNSLGYLICLLFSLWIILLRNMKRKNRLRSIGIVSVFVVGLIIAAGDEYRQLFIKDYFWVVWIICISAAALISGIFIDKNIWIRRAVTAALFIYCAAGTVFGLKISKEAFILICFLILLRAAEEIQLRWKKSGCPDTKEHITRISPVIIAVCLIVYAVPAPDDPYDWKIAKDIYKTTVSCIESIASFISRVYGYISHPSDDYGNIGFSDKGYFLAGLAGSDEEVLIIKPDNTTIRQLRLIGCISGDFRGREWIFDTETESSSRTLDTVETACALRKYAAASQSEYIRKINLYCESLFYNTRYVFSPAKIRLEDTKEKSGEICEKNGSIVSEQRLSYNDNYRISCYVLNYANPKLPEFLDSAETINEAEWIQASYAENVFDKNGSSYEDYLNYLDSIYNDFCHHYVLSEEVENIIDAIKSGSAGRYETLKKLEAYLKRMEYSTDCGTLPDSVTDAGSFLDHFLLDSKKGYCMHYATAFVLMANEMGIPCRYVQGYNTIRDISGDFVVRQSNAHAWPEAYFDNAGWVAFEPTPGFSVPSGWDNNNVPISAFDRDNENQKDYEHDENVDISEENEQRSGVIDPLIFIIPSLAVVFFLIMFYVISRSVSKTKYKKMNADDKFRFLTQQNLRFLGYLGFRLNSGETLSEFSDRITRSDRQDIKDNIGFIPIYETVLYSDREITEEDVASTENIYHTLRDLVKKSRLRFRLILMIKKHSEQ